MYVFSDLIISIYVREFNVLSLVMPRYGIDAVSMKQVRCATLSVSVSHWLRYVPKVTRVSAIEFVSSVFVLFQSTLRCDGARVRALVPVKTNRLTNHREFECGRLLFFH